VFDTWADYLGALGLPDYVNDLPRGTQTNAVMIATFDRIGGALCLRAAEKDFHANPPVDPAKRLIYKFTPAPEPISLVEFTSRLDILHRETLGYPVKLAPTDRVKRFYKLYKDTVAAHDPKSRLTASEDAWASMCQALVRHPEFHVY